MLLRSTDHIPSQEKARAELEWLSYLKSHALDLHFIEIIYDIVMSSVLQLLFHSFCPPFHIAMLQECSIHGPWKPFFFTFGFCLVQLGEAPKQLLSGGKPVKSQSSLHHFSQSLSPASCSFQSYLLHMTSNRT